MTPFKCEWTLSPANEGVDVAFALVTELRNLVRDQLSDLVDLFPFRNAWESRSHVDDAWLAVRLIDSVGLQVPTIGSLEQNEIAELKAKLLPFQSHSYHALQQLLGTEWYGFHTLTYVGPFEAPCACWPHAHEFLVAWLNHLVVPQVYKRNQQRVLRAIPRPPSYDIAAINDALWVLECEHSLRQGTAFHLEGIGLVTCAHVLGSETRAFKGDNPENSYKVTIEKSHNAIDVAVLQIDQPLGKGLPRGSADSLHQMDHLAVAGFPNYRLGDSGVIVPGLVTGFRTISAIRRVLTNAPIVAGQSGGPALDKNHRVVGIAVTGADIMERAQETEAHGIIPIDALDYL